MRSIWWGHIGRPLLGGPYPTDSLKYSLQSVDKHHTGRLQCAQNIVEMFNVASKAHLWVIDEIGLEMAIRSEIKPNIWYITKELY